MDNNEKTGNFLFYASDDGKIKIQVILGDDTVWTTQKGMAEIFETTRENITIHLKNIFESGELTENSVSKEILHTANDGKNYKTKFYNLDTIIAVGYRVNSFRATQFRIWATKILKEYLIKGFALNDERLKQGSKLFGTDYFEELLERIREIRASERRFYQKITDLYAQASIDYDVNSPITTKFYSTVQNKLHFAISNHTAAEIITSRASISKPNMGLTSWKNANTGGKILKTDVSVAKNYLTHEEISDLNRIVNMYLDYAELQAKRNKPMKMSDWAERLEAFLKFNEYEILKDSGKISHEVAKKFAESQYEKFRVIQDREFKSDFDKIVDEIKTTNKLPSEIEREKELSDFDKNLKKALNYKNKG